MVYENCTIYGPYRLADNRDRVTITSPNGVVKFVSYAKYLMEVHLDRFLDPDLETIDHIDNNFNNNNLNNLRILSRKEHCSLDAIRNKSQTFTCSMCNIEFTLSGKKLNDAFENRLKGKSGPYCSRSCAGKSSHLKLDDPRLITHNVKREKYTLKNPDTIIDSFNSNEYLEVIYS
jgi:hypothetical protein